MLKSIFEGVDFSCFYEWEKNQYMLFWRKYDIYIFLKDEDARLFRQKIELINSDPTKDVKAKIERAIKIQFYFRFASTMPHFSDD